MKLKVLSWNIWRGANLKEVIDFLKREDPDLIGLQEVIENDEFNQAEVIAKALGLHFVFGEAFVTDRHSPSYTLGNAVLSKYPIKNSEVIFLSGLEEYRKSAATEPRNMVHAEIDTESGALNFYTTHLVHTLDNYPSEFRLKQAKKLVGEIEQDNTCLLGDFNSLPDDPVIEEIGRILINTSSSPTPTWRDRDGKEFRIDYIFISSNIKFSSFKIHECNASDHKPISAELELF